ncbi:efflux RND transporter periplasmic adaptor subunit [Rurimicrobium arvi]|uniref:Efflux RND transporter periplasmic adaptor subunit n=1 Tax=Rurimicrobium arvi TaxID=2049916 RepID=A0ABP8MKS4_9BACT
MKKYTQATLYSLAALSMLSACGNSGEKEETSQTTPVEVTVSTAGTGSVNGQTEASGQVEAVRSAMISTRMMGYIQKIYVDIGDKVKQGQVLFSINAADIRAKSGQANASVAQAEAALANAKKDYERFTVLYQQNSATAKEMDNITFQYKAAQAQLEAARQMHNEVKANMSYAVVTAPFDAVITQKMMDAGSMATPGMPVLMMEQPGALQITASVTEASVTSIHEGDQVSVNISALGKQISGKVARISQSASATGGRYIVKVAIPEDKDIRSGMYATVAFSNRNLTGVQEHILIPQSSLVHQHELTGLYTIDNKKTAVLRWVRTGKVSGAQIEILSGLQAGEQYISEAHGRLYNGVSVKAL